MIYSQRISILFETSLTPLKKKIQLYSSSRHSSKTHIPDSYFVVVVF